MAERPWLILTLRRTGGTSLTTFLAQISAYRTIEHEPFNRERQLGYITRAHTGLGDDAATIAAIGDALTPKVNIKHCIEIVPPGVTRALIEVASELDYQFVVLTRRDELRRQISLMLATATGAWGPDEAAQIYSRIIAGERRIEPIDTALLAKRVRRDYSAFGQVMRQLRNRDIAFDWRLFEDIYFGPRGVAAQAQDLAKRLGVDLAPDDTRLAALSEKGRQNSVDIAAHVPNYDQAVDALKSTIFD